MGAASGVVTADGTDPLASEGEAMKQPKVPVKMLTTLTILMVFLCVGSYL